MQDIYKPFQYIERPQNPPEEPTIPPGVSGYYDERNDTFISDSESFEEAIENWDLLPYKKQREFRRFLIDLYFEDWKRIEGE